MNIHNIINKSYDIKRYLPGQAVPAIIVFAVLYYTFVRKYRPRNTFAIIKIFAATNLYAVFVYCMNLLFGSNYMLLMGPIENPTLADVFVKISGQPPLHIIGFELLALMLFLLFYIPWRIIKIRENRINAPS